MSRRPKKRSAVCGQDIVPDPLVDPGNPPHRHQACTRAHPTRTNHRMVTLAKSSPSRSTPRPSPNKNATVMLRSGLTLASSHASRFVTARAARLIVKVEIAKRLPGGLADDEARIVVVLDDPR